MGQGESIKEVDVRVTKKAPEKNCQRDLQERAYEINALSETRAEIPERIEGKKPRRNMRSKWAISPKGQRVLGRYLQRAGDGSRDRDGPNEFKSPFLLMLREQ